MFLLRSRDEEKSSNYKPLLHTKQRCVIATLELAEQFQALLSSGEINRRSELAARFCITRARVTQVLALNRLEPSIRAHALQHPRVSERVLRPLLVLGHAQQLEAAPRTGWKT